MALLKFCWICKDIQYTVWILGKSKVSIIVEFVTYVCVSVCRYIGYDGCADILRLDR